MISNMRPVMIALLAVCAMAVAGCSGADEEETFWMSAADEAASYQESAPQAPAAAMARQGAPGDPGAPGAAGGRTIFLSEPQAAAAPAAPAAPAPAMTKAAAGSMADAGDGGTQDQVAQLATQRRIIVYTVDMTLEVADVAASVDTVGALAQQMGGWVVSTNRAEKHRGFVAIRVPADRLEEAIARLRGIAADVVSEISSSRDVTDEYVDLTSRLGNLNAAEAALLRLFDRAQTVEEALDVRRTLTEVQGEIEVLKGRIAFLEQTSAFSLVNVTLVLEPQDIQVDAGGEQVAGVGHPVTFRAFFDAPEGIEDFSYTWDFGDATPTLFSDRTARTTDGGWVTAPVTHYYEDDDGSPFFAQITIMGTGEAGAVEGKASVVVTVSDIPVIEVFAGDDFSVEEDEEVFFSGSFTRPEGRVRPGVHLDVRGRVAVGNQRRRARRHDRRSHSRLRRPSPGSLHRHADGDGQDGCGRRRGVRVGEGVGLGERGLRDRRLERRRHWQGRHPGPVGGRRRPVHPGYLAPHIQPGLDRRPAGRPLLMAPQGAALGRRLRRARRSAARGIGPPTDAWR